MVHRYHRRYRRFIDLPRHRRADIAFDVRSQIKRGPYRNFYSYDYLDEGVSWSDVYFVGQDRATMWNATLMTTSDVFAEQQWNDAYDLVMDQLSPDEQADHLRSISFNREDREKTPHGTYKWGQRLALPMDRFEGRSVLEQIRHVADTLVPSVYEQIVIDTKYAHGIGLHVTLDIEILNAEIISKFVDDFVSGGEKAYRCESPAINIHGRVQQGNAIVFG